MDLDVVGDLADIETITIGRGIRELARLRRLYGGSLEEDEKRRADPAQGWQHPARRIALYEAHGIGKKEFKRKRYLD